MVQTGNIVYRINRAHGLPSFVHELTERISTRRVSNLTRSIYCEVWHPLRVRVKPTTFPVVSADSDHRLLSCNPSGCGTKSVSHVSLASLLPFCDSRNYSIARTLLERRLKQPNHFACELAGDSRYFSSHST